MKNMKRIHKVVIKRMVDTSPDTSYLGQYSNHDQGEFAIDRQHSEDCPRFFPNQDQQERSDIAQLERVNSYLCEQFNQHVTDELCDWYDDGQTLIADLINDLCDECTCGESGSWSRGEYRYFNPATVEAYNENASWIPKEVRSKKQYWHDAMVHNAKQDYARMESLNAGNWCYIGIRADATYFLSTKSDDDHCALMQELTSGGSWGIESDSDESFLKEIEQEQLSELREQLHGIGFSYRAIAKAFKDIKHKEE